jgi:DmsE family decaheme c-type cytochrome
MNDVNRRGLRWFLLVVILAASTLWRAGPAGAQTAPGPEVCKNCHEEKYASFLVSQHSMKADARTPGARGGCVACHGDGTEHVKAGGGKGVGGIKNPASPLLAAHEKNAICLTCHQGGKRIHWQGSVHASRDTTCASCHTVHTQNDPVRDKMRQPGVCIKCHQDKRVQIVLPYRHPIEEGKVACSDCHNPHGGIGPFSMVRDTVNDTCYTCHMEKRGPFVRTHQPVQEDCSICHNPHGTTMPNLLKMRPPFLCQQCHEPTSHRGNVASFTGTSTSANTLARGCLNCHTNIHGTNNPANISNERTFRR